MVLEVVDVLCSDHRWESTGWEPAEVIPDGHTVAAGERPFWRMCLVCRGVEWRASPRRSGPDACDTELRGVWIRPPRGAATS